MEEDFFDFRERTRSKVDSGIEDLATKVIGAAIEVHRIIGPGFPGIVYRKALSHELDLRGIPYECEFAVAVFYKGMEVGTGSVDILVAGKLILELKVAERLSEAHRAQALAYLAALHLPLALLINFNTAILRDGIKRVIRTS